MSPRNVPELDADDWPDGVPPQPHYWDNGPERLPACRDHPRREDWFPESIHFAEGRAAAVRAATICRDCPVLLECRSFSLALRPTGGVWGGVYWQQSRTRATIGRPSRANPLIPGLPPTPDPDFDPKHSPPRDLT